MLGGNIAVDDSTAVDEARSKELADFFWELLEAGGEHPALIDERGSLSYAELVKRIECFAQHLRLQLMEGVQRPLVLLEAVNEIDAIVAYLACLRARYPVILVAEGQASGSSIARTYEPNLIIARGAGQWRVSRFSGAPVLLHPELAVLLSTSGTTGAAKLVRLSAANLQANARAIAAYLGLTPSERGITALPYHYSYGMSVLHIHLLAHASLVLTQASVVDDAFWTLASGQGVTSLALVPTQFELLEQRAFSKAALPSLRYITQAGGKLDPKLALSFAQRARAEAWRLFFMYGQTEAGPRMSYVPAEDAERWHHTIGRPVEGGRFRLLAADGEEIANTEEPGELVYEGPNVMLGYAMQRADLADSAGPAVLRTGDVAQRVENGYFKIVGRTSRFIKLFGLRISLDEVESTLRAEGHGAYVSGSDEALVVFLRDGVKPDALRIRVARRYGWPERVVRVVSLDAVPLLSSGKVDYREFARRAAALAPSAEAGTTSDLAELLRSVLGEASLDLEKSFVDHGGSSLSHLEVQLFFSKRGGEAPDSWERLPFRELLAFESSRPEISTRWQRIPADLLARTVAILAVLALHSTTWQTGGGSILLLVLSGYTLARFQSEVLFRGQVGKTLWSMLGRVVGVYYVCIAVAAAKFFPFDVRWFLLSANVAEEIEPTALTPYWFVSTYVQIIVLACLPFLIPRVRARVKTAPFATGMLALLTLSAAIEVLPLHDIYYNVRHRNPVIALELLLAGWVIFFARKPWQKLLASAALLTVWFQNFGMLEPNITALLLGGSLSMLWGLGLALPPRAARALLAFGSLSLFVYVAHVPILYVLGRFVPAGAPCFAILTTVSIAGGWILARVSTLVAEHATRAARRWTAAVAPAGARSREFGPEEPLLTAEALALARANGSAPVKWGVESLEQAPRLRRGDRPSAESAAVDDAQDSDVVTVGGEPEHRSR